MTRYAFRRPWKRAAARAFDAAGRALFRPRARAFGPPRNLLIVRLDHLGDAWNVTGLPKAVKEHIAGCRVTCLVSSAAAPLFEANPFVDEILRWDAPWFWKKRRSMSRTRLVLELRRRRFDAALSIRGDVREHAILYAAGVRRRIGPGITGGEFWLTDRVPWDERTHELERIAAAAEPLGLPRRVWKPEIHFAPGEIERLQSEAEAKGLRRGVELVGFQAEAGTPAKSWPAAHSARFVAGLLDRRPQGQVVLLGADVRPAHEILRRLDSAHTVRTVNLCGRLSLRELAACAARFALVVAPDSGPSHMLAWLGAPTLFLYSGTNAFESWKPLAEQAAAIRHDVPCAPCGLRLCPVAGHPCMEGIDPVRVAETAAERLG